MDETSPLNQADVASQETQQDATQTEAGAETATGSEEAQAEVPGSSTSPDTTSQTPDKAPVQRDWQAELSKAEKQAADWRAKHNQSSNQLHDYRTKYADVDPDAVRKWKAANARAEKENLPVWHKDNPKNHEFKGSLSKFKTYQAAMAKADTPEKKAFLQETMGALFSQSEAEQIQKFDEHRQQFAEQFAMDPHGTIADIIRSEMRGEIQTERMEMQATDEVNQWMTAPDNQPIVQKYGPQMLEALNRGNQWEFVRQMAMDRARLEGLQSRVGTADRTTAHARAQSDLAKRKAVVTKDGAIKPQRDIAAEVQRVMKEKGWGPNHPGVMDLIEKLQKTSAI